jgi:hypothetical protein
MTMIVLLQKLYTLISQKSIPILQNSRSVFIQDFNLILLYRIYTRKYIADHLFVIFIV